MTQRVLESCGERRGNSQDKNVALDSEPKDPMRREHLVLSVRRCQALKRDTGRTSRARTVQLQVEPLRDRSLWVG